MAVVRDGIIYENERFETIIGFEQGTKDVVIPKSTRAILGEAFNNITLNSIVIPDTIQFISADAKVFENCDQVIIDGNRKKVAQAFANPEKIINNEYKNLSCTNEQKKKEPNSLFKSFEPITRNIQRTSIGRVLERTISQAKLEIETAKSVPYSVFRLQTVEEKKRTRFNVLLRNVPPEQRALYANMPFEVKCQVVNMAGNYLQFDLSKINPKISLEQINTIATMAEMYQKYDSRNMADILSGERFTKNGNYLSVEEMCNEAGKDLMTVAKYLMDKEANRLGRAINTIGGDNYNELKNDMIKLQRLSYEYCGHSNKHVDKIVQNLNLYNNRKEFSEINEYLDTFVNKSRVGAEKDITVALYGRDTKTMSDKDIKDFANIFTEKHPNLKDKQFVENFVRYAAVFGENKALHSSRDHINQEVSKMPKGAAWDVFRLKHNIAEQTELFNDEIKNNKTVDLGSKKSFEYDGKDVNVEYSGKAYNVNIDNKDMGNVVMQDNEALENLVMNCINYMNSGMEPQQFVQQEQARQENFVKEEQIQKEQLKNNEINKNVLDYKKQSYANKASVIKDVQKLQSELNNIPGMKDKFFVSIDKKGQLELKNPQDKKDTIKIETMKFNGSFNNLSQQEKESIMLATSEFRQNNPPEKIVQNLKDYQEKVFENKNIQNVGFEYDKTKIQNHIPGFEKFGVYKGHLVLITKSKDGYHTVFENREDKNGRNVLVPDNEFCKETQELKQQHSADLKKMANTLKQFEEQHPQIVNPNLNTQKQNNYRNDEER